jgi:hypothetical protein
MARVRVKYTVRSAIDARAAATQCDCCGLPPPVETDHCHEHSWIRGPVCKRCNSLLGKIESGLLPDQSDGATIDQLLDHLAGCPDCERVDVSALRPSRGARGYRTLRVPVGHASVLDQLALEESVPVGRRVTLVDVMVAALALADSERPRIRELLKGQR